MHHSASAIGPLHFHLYLANYCKWYDMNLLYAVRASAATLHLMAKFLKPRITKMLEIDRNHVKSCYHILYSIHVGIHLTWKRIWLDVPGVAAWLRTCLSADVSILNLGLVGHKWEQTESWSHRGIKAWAGHWWWGHLTWKRMLQRLIANQWRTTVHNMSTKQHVLCGTEVWTPGSTVGWKFT